jgi:hypothetical protein
MVLRIVRHTVTITENSRPVFPKMPFAPLVFLRHPQHLSRPPLFLFVLDIPNHKDTGQKAKNPKRYTFLTPPYIFKVRIKQQNK